MPRPSEQPHSTVASAPAASAPIDAESPRRRGFSGRRLLDLLLSTERRRRFHLLQTALALFGIASGMAALAFLARQGIADARSVRWLTWFAVPGWFGFLVAIRTGCTRRLADPALTLWQMVYAVACCGGAYAIAGAARGAVFLPLMLVLMFNIFSLTLRQTAGLIGVTLALFGGVMTWMAGTRPEVYLPTVERTHFWMMLTIIPAVAVLAWQLQKLRARLRERTRALEASLDRNRWLATRDELTGLVNRRQLLALIEREHLRTARGDAGYCLALIDLDHFKQVNDRHGHAAGDAVLQAFSREALRQLRAADALGRWGGEEFLLLMPDATLPAAREGIERLRHAWGALTIAHGEALLSSTFSAGIVQRRGDETYTRTIERADAALYRAKSTGRDRVLTERERG